MNRNVNELLSKLKSHRLELKNVEKMLEKEPTNVQLINLRDDLIQVINLTEDLLDVTEPGESSNSDNIIATEKIEREAFSVGSRVETLSRDTWYPSVIREVSEDTQSFTVEYIGFQGQDVKTLAMLRQIKLPPDPVNAAEVEIGKSYLGFYIGDMNWYNCIVEEKTENGYAVTFVDYGNKEELPIEYLQKIPTLNVSTAESTVPSVLSKVLPKAALNDDGTFRIPDNLKLQHTDSEAEKVRKRNKVKALKLLYRNQKSEKESLNKQNSWKAFADSKGKRKVSGTMKNVRKESIFKSPDNLEGKVGVIGSGQGMTEFERKKKFRKT